MSKPANAAIHIKFATPEAQPSYVGAWVQRDVQIDLSTGAVSGYFGRHVAGSENTESKPFSCTIADVDLKKIAKIIRESAQAAQALPAGTDEE